MRYIISESKLNSIIYDYLNGNLVPDYGWETKGYYLKDSERYGYVSFPINDNTAYLYLYRENELNDNEPKTIYIAGNIASILTDLFGELWKPVFAKWFEDHTALPVEHFMVRKF